MHRRNRSHPVAARRRGVAMVITLLGLILLVALVMFVINLGQQVNRRVTVQNSADAAAHAAAGWIARSMNTAAMGNVAITHQIALVNILDAAPDASRFTGDEVESLIVGLEDQLIRGVPSLNNSGGDIGQVVEDELDRLLEELNTHLQHLNAAVASFDEYDVREVTFYDAPSGERGRLWRTMVALELASRTSLDHVGVIAQLAAVHAGRNNLQSDDGEVLLLPMQPNVPYVRGHFDDFRTAVIRGRLPDVIDDPIIRRGPYDTIFGWRSLQREQGEFIGTGNQTSGGRGSVPVGSGATAQTSGYWIPGEVIGYDTYGPHRWLLGRVGSFGGAELRHSRFASRMGTMATMKLRYLWPSNGSGGAVTLGTVIAPNWIVNYDEARRIAQQGGGVPLQETAFFVVEIKSRYPRTHSSFLTPGSWSLVQEGALNPRVAYVGGWMDPAGWGVPKVSAHVWVDEWSYQVSFDTDIGIAQQFDIDGNPVMTPVYRVDHFAFAGLNIGPRVTVRNPHEGLNRAAAAAPLYLDHDEVTINPDLRWPMLRVFAAVQEPDDATLWPTRFAGGKPYPHNVAIAEADVFNNHSWDLWTQMWHAQQCAVERLYDSDGASFTWLDVLDDGITNGQFDPEIDPTAASDMLQYLYGLRELGALVMEPGR